LTPNKNKNNANEYTKPPQKGNKIHTTNNNRNQQLVLNLHTFSSVYCQKEKLFK